MPIALESENDIREQRHWFVRLINCIRIYNIPLLNFIIISILGSFLIKLMTKYTNLYMKSSLITIIVTNLVLYGISESLAQSILSYKPNQPGISFRFNPNAPSVGLSFNSNDLINRGNLNQLDTRDIGSTGFNVYRDEEEAVDLGNVEVNSRNATDNISIDEEGVERFIEYLQNDNESIEDNNFNNFGDLPSPIVELTYYQFNRLAGFMCWGFIMAFIQCWWYKFLQIYSTDPKFIEVLRKVLTDQLCFSPISLFSFFTYGTIVLENGTWDQAKIKLSKIYLKTLLINYSVWFPVQFFNFLIVPRNFQVPFSSSVSVLWNCFLSMRNSNS
ncbi:uncharacterized protein RJT21DRAFT_49008 [Scheffersomyces amazonensis]|uniref:uncharacterized protein n=1 Tax=Scheffersomyces amazonensis TaxID=1078765 RepID=UPI00315DDB1A